MLAGIDHAVVLVTDLEAAVSRWRSAGFTVTLGGRHRPAPTENAIIAFADSSYVELFAFRMPHEAHRWWPLRAQERIIDYSCISTDLDRDIAHVERAGVSSYPRQVLQRVVPNGDVAEWFISAPRGHHAGVIPFLIADVTSRTVRVPSAPVHSNGALGIACVAVAVPSLKLVDPWCKNLAGWTYRPAAGEAMDAELQRHEQSIRFVAHPRVAARSPSIELFLRTVQPPFPFKR